MESEVEEENHIESVIIGGDYGTQFVQPTQSKETSNSGTPKAKYYRQTYRTAWENMPDFKGWLRGVVGEPTRAYCIYCEKTLHAHRLSLLKHTCTIKHQKAEQLHRTNKKGKIQFTTKATLEAANSSKHIDVEDAIESFSHYNNEESPVQEIEDQEEEFDEIEEEEEESIPMESIQIEIQKPTIESNKPGVSTQVLDSARGCPVANLQVTLYKLIDGRWTYVNEGTTNNEGRCASFIELDYFVPGRYKLHFDVDRYFEMKKTDTIFPFIEIVFDNRNPRDTYHLPLILSPFGYTTYKS